MPRLIAIVATILLVVYFVAYALIGNALIAMTVALLLNSFAIAIVSLINDRGMRRLQKNLPLSKTDRLVSRFARWVA